MMNTKTQTEKADEFRKLHHSQEMLVLANIWDPLGALLLERLGYHAVATASAAIAYSNGYNDGENIPLPDLLRILKNIVNRVNIPVTADFESGYADSDTQLRENIRRVIETGVVGINFEDSDKKTNQLLPSKMQCDRIRLIRSVAQEMKVPLFINARSDVYVRGHEFRTDEEKFDEILARGTACKEAGADCFFPIMIKRRQDIEKLIALLQMPVNIIVIPGLPSLRELSEAGVARISLGPSFLKTALQAMKKLALQLKNHEGVDEVTGNEITTDYLKELVKKN